MYPMQTTADPHATPRFPEDDQLFLAGHKAPAGHYILVGTQQEVRLDYEDDLPATCDGRVAIYLRRPESWSERQMKSTA
jgi:hypothetical protein